MISNIKEAMMVQTAINAVIPDIKLFWNNVVERWVVAQIKENPGGLILPGDMSAATRPYTLYKIETKDGKYRPPSQVDVQRAIEIGKFGREAIEKGGDWLIDQIEKGERAQKEAAAKRLRDKVAAIAPEMKRAYRGDTQHGRVKS